MQAIAAYRPHSGRRHALADALVVSGRRGGGSICFTVCGGEPAYWIVEERDVSDHLRLLADRAAAQLRRGSFRAMARAMATRTDAIEFTT